MSVVSRAKELGLMSAMGGKQTLARPRRGNRAAAMDYQLGATRRSVVNALPTMPSELGSYFKGGVFD